MNRRGRINQLRKRIIIGVSVCGLGILGLQGKRVLTMNMESVQQLSVQGIEWKKDPVEVNISEMENGTERGTCSINIELELEAKRLAEEYPELLLLVNKEDALEQEQIPALRIICKGRLQAADFLYQDLCNLLRDAGKEKLEFWIASAYRSREYQQEIIDRNFKRNKELGMSDEEALAEVYKESMPAGHSEHETGMALDVLASSDPNMDQGQESTAENQWLQEHCHEYGFIIRYPKAKESITGISYEPWHIRYVGKEAAEFMTKHQLTLEEFWDLVKE